MKRFSYCVYTETFEKILVILVFGMMFYGIGNAILYEVSAKASQSQDPNAVADPNTIKLPEGARLPAQLKCPVHGMIGKEFVAIEADGKTKVYCKQCIQDWVCRVFDLNLPKLEVVK